MREFEKASHTSFSFEYFIYPAICVLFNLYYPREKSVPHRIGWFLFFPSWMTVLEVLIEHYTQLINYIHWTWYWTWLSLFITFVFSFLFYHWFFKIKIR
ncbi:CBO0543 family protein [Bacillus sp. T3]|uniref:CBO0543 family protein n=1 Tax=Bacillus sp. T3 TaxID=467262 RepID=UPI0029828D82|nr:CBO0543 family protein [Bacillus sp. T3]